MKKRTAAVALLMAISPAFAQGKCDEIYGKGANKFSLATGSPGELGLLKALAEPFTKQTNSNLCWKKAGSGESLKLLKDKAVDMIMVRAPAAADKAIGTRKRRKSPITFLLQIN